MIFNHGWTRLNTDAGRARHFVRAAPDNLGIGAHGVTRPTAVFSFYPCLFVSIRG